MRITYDGDGDTLSIILRNGKIEHAEDRGPIVANFDQRNRLIEIEILSASKVLGDFVAAVMRAKPNSKLVEVEI